MKSRILVCVLVIVVLGICTQYGIADEFDWPRWRGPNGDGISMEADWDPEALHRGPKILWKVNVGMGHSNVVIKGKYLYTMGHEGLISDKVSEDTVYCLKVKNGKTAWQYSYSCISGKWGMGTQVTPVIDGSYVYTLSIQGDFFCFNAKKGMVQWKNNIVEDYDVQIPLYEFAGSPVIEGDLIILTANTSGIALNKNTGEMVWVSEKPPENLRLPYSTGPHYATPVLYEYEGKRCAVITSYVGVHSVEVETGKLLWSYKWEPFRAVQAADPLIFNNKVFITQYFKHNGSVLLDIGGGEPKVLWKNLNMHSEFSSPLMIDGYIYGVRGGPERRLYSYLCLDVETGEVMWEEDLRTREKQVRPNQVSLMAADGKLIILEDDGTLRIAEASPSSYKEISSGNVFGDERKSRSFWTHPVLCNSKIYCRNRAGDLVCVDVSK